MQLLNRKNANLPNTLPLRVMQFGGGNFLRAFVDWMVDILNEQVGFNAGIAIVKPTEHGDYAKLKAQDGLFTVVLNGIKKGQLLSENRLVTAVQKVINPYTEWEDYLELANHNDLRFVVSNTTEAGIKFDAGDKFNDDPPGKFPAKLTVWLLRRFEHFQGNPTKGCVFLPCELIATNGEALRTAILEYAEHWNLSTDFKSWIYSSNHFCNTLVDRIVSGYPTGRAQQIEAELGYEDKLMVAGEQYHSWIIQAPPSVQKELPFDRIGLNVQFVDDLTPYRNMKVRILNGAHTALVPVAYLAGFRFVNEAMANEEILHFVKSLLLEEISPTLGFSNKVTQQYVQDVLDRFRNPTLKHRLIAISLNSTSKFATRLLPSLKEYQNTQEKLPKRIVFSLAALILFYRGIYQGIPIKINDSQEVIDRYTDAWEKFNTNENDHTELVQHILSQTAFWGEDIGTIPKLQEQLVSYLKLIDKKGLSTAMVQIGQ